MDKLEETQRKVDAMTTAEHNERQLADQWLGAELNRIWIVAERCLRQFQRAQLRPQPDHPSVAEIEGIFTARRTARNGGSTGPLDEAELARALSDAESKIEGLRRAAPIGRIIENLKLQPLEVETIVVAMAPHIDAPLADAFALLRGQQARRGVDLALVSQLFRLKRGERVALLDALDPERPLLSWRLIQVMSNETFEAYGSATHRAIQPTFDLLSVLCGRGELPPALQRVAKLRREKPTLDDLSLDPAQRAQIETLCAAAQQAQQTGRVTELPWIITWGAKGAGKQTLASRRSRPTPIGPALLFNPAMADKGTLDDLIRRAAARGASCAARCSTSGPLGGDLISDQGKELVKRISEYPSVIVLGVDGMQPPRIRHLDHPAQELQMTLPSEPIRPRTSGRGDRAGGAARRERRARLAVARLQPDPGRDHRLRERGAHRRGDGEQPQGSPLGPAQQRGSPPAQRARRDGAPDLGQHQVGTDLVLSPEDMARVQEFISRKLYATQVYEDWGYGARVGYGKGMIALFSGPPGTGKTMLAGLIASTLDLDMYQVDLASVVSKWVGETEKQLAKVFDQAERAHAVLLFDEADSLFAKRTEVKSSNDRYGNLAVNYLLQRLEQYTGVAILTTNKEAAIDEAVQRRLSLHLHLEIPEADERERLWKSFMPPKAPVEAINFRELAESFELSGGYIKNAAVRAAFLAASAKVSIQMSLLRRAAALELEDMGRVVMRGEPVKRHTFA